MVLTMSLGLWLLFDEPSQGLHQAEHQDDALFDIRRQLCHWILQETSKHFQNVLCG